MSWVHIKPLLEARLALLRRQYAKPTPVMVLAISPIFSLEATPDDVERWYREEKLNLKLNVSV